MGSTAADMEEEEVGTSATTDSPPAAVAAKRGAGDVECGRQGWR